MKHAKHLLAALLSLTALTAGQTAEAENKTVTYTFTVEFASGNPNRATFTFTPTGDQFGTRTGTKTATISDTRSTTGFTVDLDDGVRLTYSQDEGKLSFMGSNAFCLNWTNDGGNSRFTVSCTDYYIRHVKLATSSGNVLSGTGMPVPTSNGLLDVDVDIAKYAQYTANVSSVLTFGSITLTLADHPYTAPENITGLTYNGTEGYYEIADADDLCVLAAYVNDNHNCAGLSFKQTADITFSHNTAWNDDESTEHNFDGIGYAIYNTSGSLYEFGFSGTFDGGGHTVSGIRIYKPRTACFGLFGDVDGAAVKNIVLADTRITGTTSIGGIVGRNNHSTVSGCTVGSNVTICGYGYKTLQACSVGGIVGMNWGGTVTGCTSSAVLTTNNVDYSNYFGGVVGSNSGSVSDCHAYGVILPNVEAAGAIVGQNNWSDGTSAPLSGNTYHSCIWGSYAFNIGVGEYYILSGSYVSGDQTGAAVNTYSLWLFENRDNSAVIAGYAATYTGNSSTAYGATHPSVGNLTVTLKGCTLYKDGKWNTLCLPFDVGSLTGDTNPLKGATLMEIDKTTANASGQVTGFDSGSGTLTLNFKNASSIEKRKPYIVKWESGENILEPQFRNVNGSRLGSLSSNTGFVTSTDGSVTFRSTFSPVSLTAGDNTKLVFGRNNTVGFPTEDGSLPAFNSYFTVNNGAEISDIVLDFGDGTNTISVTARQATFAGQNRYWATFCHPSYNYRLPAGAQAFTMGSDKALYRVGDGSVIPAGCAVVIMADASELTLTMTGNSATPEDGNILRGTSASTSASTLVSGSQKVYVLGASGGTSGTVGFFPYTGTLPANKAYYVE